jgi:hypothetical protein
MSTVDQPFTVREVLQAGWQNASPEQVSWIARHALAAPQSDGWVYGSRFIETADGALLLQCATVGDATRDEAESVDWDQLANRARDLIELADDESDGPDPGEQDDPIGLDVLEAIEAVLLSIDSLAPALSLDDEQPAILIAPEAADWAFAITPTREAEWVRVLLPLTLIPDAPEAQCEPARRALRINDLRLLGVECSIIVNAEADLLLLQALVPTTRVDPEHWTAFFGRMLGLREVMLEDWGSAETSTGTASAASDELRHLHFNALRV